METTTKTKISERHADMKSRGIDTDPENEPTYPLKDDTGDDHKGSNHNKPEQQPVDTEVLHSDERPSVSSFHSTSTLPSRLSGLIRRLAFRYSESSFGHWFPLIFADRINIWAGFVPDFKRAKAQKGAGKYNKKQLIAKTGASVLVGAFVFAWLITKGKRRKAKSKRKK